MHHWYTAYNPKTKEACQFYVVGSAIDGFLEKDSKIIRAFFYRNAPYELKLSAQDELLDETHEDDAIFVNELSEREKEEYIQNAYG